MRTVFGALIVALTFLALCASQRCRAEPASDYVASVADFVRRHERQLSDYVANLASGQTPKIPGATGFVVPSISAAADLSVRIVTRDDQGHTYFITESWPSWNVGFVHCIHGQPLSDGMERVVYTEWLFGPWWYYKAH